jgi:hypothetical protein
MPIFMSKKIPSIWWDLEEACNEHHKCYRFESMCDNTCKIQSYIVIESDDPKYPIIKCWAYEDDWGKHLPRTEQFIKDINEGRLSFYKVAKAYSGPKFK